jgi:hypothetical protein
MRGSSGESVWVAESALGAYWEGTRQ